MAEEKPETTNLEPEKTTPENDLGFQTACRKRLAALSELKQYLDKIEPTCPRSRGFGYLKTFSQNKPLQSRQAIIAKCCDCLCYYSDGLIDCRCYTCPLYQFMPYREDKTTPKKEQ